MPPQSLAVLATLVTFGAHGNRVEMQLSRGSAELVWISPSSFHFRRSLQGPLQPVFIPLRQEQPVELQVDDRPDVVHFRSKVLDVEIRKSGLLVKVTGPGGVPLMADLSEPRSGDLGVEWEREARPGVRFYGLGALGDPEMDLRGKMVPALQARLLSSAGYSEEHPGPGPFRYDFTAADRYRIAAPLVDYYFTYGRTPKEIFKQLDPDVTRGPVQTLVNRPGWEGLRDELLETVHQAMTTSEPRPFNLNAYSLAPEELKQRARQFGSILPAVSAGPVNLSPFRTQLASFFDIYALELRDRHFPVLHPLPFEYPEDPNCALHGDEFLLGDEMLIAPIYQPGSKRQVYLPPGKWTSLESETEYPGRSTITVETAALPVFAHNGAIVPLDSNGALGLHYFPNSGGEFFLIEKDLGQYTQLHAGPALDILRLEIESKKDRSYHWVVHHVEKPSSVGFGDVTYPAVATESLKDRTWYYDAQRKLLMVRVRVKAGEDNIINVGW